MLPEAILVNSHDRSSAYQLFIGLYRVICLNGLVSDETQDETERFKIRHSGGADFADRVIDVTYRVMENAENALKTAGDWHQIRLTEPQQLAFATAALEVKDTKTVQPSSCSLPGVRGRASSDGSRDLFDTFNVVQEHMIRGGDPSRSQSGRRSRTRPIKSVDSDLRINRALWTLAAEMAKLAK